jgi:hypothetical protein
MLDTLQQQEPSRLSQVANCSGESKKVNQCCSLTKERSRCPNDCIGTSMHCAEHSLNAKKLYSKYKLLSEYIKTIDIYKQFDSVDEQLEYVSQYHALLIETFFARYKHRYYSIAPECYDDGHNYQFVMLQKKLTECEALIDSLKNDTRTIAISKNVSKHIIETPLTKENLMSKKLMVVGLTNNVFKQNMLAKILLKSDNFINNILKDNSRLIRFNKKSHKLVPVPKEKVEQLEWVKKVQVNIDENKIVTIDNVSGKEPTKKKNKNKKKKLLEQLQAMVPKNTKPKNQPKKKKKKKEVEEKKEIVIEKPIPIVIDKKDKYPPLILELLNELIDFEDESEEYILCVIIEHLIQVFTKDKIGILEDGFKPRICPCEDCGRYVMYDVSIDCRCYRNFKSTNEYLRDVKNSLLMDLHKKLRLKGDIIRPLMFDIRELYDEYGLHIFEMKLDLRWNYDLERYALCNGADSDSESHYSPAPA